MGRPKAKCVLLAERHSGLTEGIRALLETQFEAIIMVADAASLFEGVEGVRPAVAVVELSLSRDTGVDLLRQLRSRFPELKIIALSMHKEPSIARMAMSAGATGYVLKSCLATDLPLAVESALAEKPYVSPSIHSRNPGSTGADGSSNHESK